ncbi:MAG: type III-B CRISPR module RAMP protein Cmr4 [Cyanobacteria bacterium P01_E01_bin.42]
MHDYLTYLYLLTSLHTGGSADEGNLMGIAREVHTEFPYLPSSSLRGKIRASLEGEENAGTFFGQKIENGKQPTEGEVWFADATLLFFPIASLSHHMIWITCPLWLRRWNQWLNDGDIDEAIAQCDASLSKETPALVSFTPESLFLQTALLKPNELTQLDSKLLTSSLSAVTRGGGAISNLLKKLVVISDEDCITLVETGLQREVRVALETGSKTVKGGSFRSEEAIPPETVLFFPWGTKPPKEILDPETKKTKKIDTQAVRGKLNELLGGKLQLGGLEGLGRGWTNAKTISTSRQGGKQ